MLTMRELRIKTMEFGNEVRMMESQEKPLEVCRVHPIVNGPPKLILTKPSCANKENHNVTPYNYGYIANVKTHAPLFQAEITRLTWSCRYFTPEALRKTKGKEVVDLDKELKVNKPVTEKESNKFLKLIKHSEYCIVDQLKKTSARIPLISLILSFEPH